MANKSLFSSLVGKLPAAADCRNEAGGQAYAFESKHALAQYAVTGCLNATFYADAADQLNRLLKLAAAVDKEFVAKTAVYCRTKGFMKDTPALLAAYLAKNDCALLARVFDRVIDDGKMLRNFVQIVRNGVTGRKSLGSAPKGLVRRWLESRDEEQIFKASVGQSPSLADVIKMVHPRPRNAQREALYGWMIGQPHNEEILPPLVRQFQAFKSGLSKVAPDVPFQMLTALSLDAKAWRSIAANASWQMTRMNLKAFARHGVFENAEMTRAIANRLRDAAKIRRARCFPYQLLTAYQSAGKSIPAKVRNALESAMETAIENIPEIAGRVAVCPDVSGSMHSPVTGFRKGATTATKCIDVAGLMAAAILRRNPDAVVLPFSDQAISCKVNAHDSVMGNAQKLACLPSGGTDCSAPLRLLNKERRAVDLVVIVSDNMSWIKSVGGGRSTATMQEWSRLRSRNPRAKLVCIDLQPYGSSQAQEREDILNIGGFSDAVFTLLASFAAGELSQGHWVGLIEQIEL